MVKLAVVDISAQVAASLAYATSDIASLGRGPDSFVMTARDCGMVGVLILSLTGCGDPAQLPPPGAEGPIHVWRWDKGRDQPVKLTAARLRQVSGKAGTSNATLELSEVVVHVPFAGGQAIVSSPDGRYDAGGDPEAILPSPAPAVGGTDRWVSLVVVRDATAGIGRAHSAWLASDGTGPYFSQVELVHAGLVTFHEKARIADKGLQVSGRGSSRSAPLAVATALAALPANALDGSSP